MLCKECKLCKTKPVGQCGSSYSICKALPKKDRGVQVWRNTVNPKCPLKDNKSKGDINEQHHKS